jgi:branched-chain amino acid transport system permease protein
MMKMRPKTKYILSAVVILVALGILWFLDANKSQYSYAISILQRSAIYAIVAVSMNLLTGFTGLFSLGQAGFMAIGAYTVAILTIPVALRPNVYYINGIADFLSSAHLPLWAALILGGFLAALVGGLIGIPVLRLKSDYLAIATLGFSEIIRAIIAAPQMDRITNGSYGLKSIPAFDSIFQVFGIATLCIVLMILVINSSYGRAFKAIKEDETAAEAMGINLFKHKGMSFIISCFFTGVAGGLLAVFMRSIDSKTFQVALTYDILLIVILGGLGSITGSIVGSFLMTAGREWLRFFDNPLMIGGFQVPLFRNGFRMVIFSMILMAVVLYYRKGLMGNKEFTWDGLYNLYHKLKARFRRRTPGKGDQGNV